MRRARAFLTLCLTLSVKLREIELVVELSKALRAIEVTVQKSALIEHVVRDDRSKLISKRELIFFFNDRRKGRIDDLNFS